RRPHGVHALRPDDIAAPGATGRRYGRSMLPEDWTPHRREDGELLGWIRPEGDDWVAMDLLGAPVCAPTDWLDAEAALEARGLGWLADVWMLEGEAPTPLRVR